MNIIKQKIAASLAPILLVSAIACSNELDINAEWRLITNVTGILELEMDTHWIRIGRTYLGNQGFQGGAQSPDSLYLEDINVRIEEKNQAGQTINTYVLERDNTKHKLDEGFFTTEGYRLYKFGAQLNANNTYHLTIERPDWEEVVTSETGLVRPFIISSPRPNQRVNFVSLNGFVIAFESEPRQVYQGFVRFYYNEHPKNNPTDIATKYVDYPLPMINGQAGSSPSTYSIPYRSFFNFLANNIPKDPNIYRYFLGIEVSLTAGAEDLATFIRVNQPSNTLSQDRPEFTNINNGIGLFSSRHTEFSNDNKIHGFDMTEASLDSLRRSRITCDLRFVRLVNFDQDTCVCNNYELICP